MEEDGAKPKIVWGLAVQAEKRKSSVLDEERERHKMRANKFSVEYVDPTKRPLMRLEARKERLAREGFTTGFDLFSQEEIQRRNARAERFQISESALEYRPDEEEEAKKRRALKFGTQYQPTEKALMDMDLFEERKDVPLEVERREDTIHLYGVDVMSTANVLQYFTQYGPTFVEWLDDSSCNVMFKDAFSTKRAIAGKGKPFPAEDNSYTKDLNPTDPDNMKYFWHKGEDFVKDGTSIKLVYRMATVEDKRDPNAPRKTRELWKSSQRGGRSQSNKAARQDGSQDGSQMDVDKRARGERGGQRVRRRKGRAGGGQFVEEDVEMMDTDITSYGDDDNFIPLDGPEPSGGAWNKGGPVDKSIGARAHVKVKRNAESAARKGPKDPNFDMGPPAYLLSGAGAGEGAGAGAGEGAGAAE